MREFKALAGNTSTRLWKAAKSHLPRIAQRVLSRVELEGGAGGCSHKDLDQVLALMEERVGQLQWTPECMARRLGAEDSIEEDLGQLCNARDALYEAMRELGCFRRKIKRNGHPEWGVCALCWRFGHTYRAGNYYCMVHEPQPLNAEYKSAKALLAYRERGRTQGPTVLIECARAVATRLPMFLDILDPTIEYLTRAFHGYEIASTVEPKALPFEEIWRELPFVCEFLSEKELNLKICSIHEAIAYIDPVDSKHLELHERLHVLLANDQRLFVGMLIYAEATLKAAHHRRKNWGGNRRTRKIEAT